MQKFFSSAFITVSLYLLHLKPDLRYSRKTEDWTS